MAVVSFSHEQVTCRVLRKNRTHPLDGCPTERDLAEELKRARLLDKMVRLKTPADGSGEYVTILLQPPADGVEPEAPFRGFVFRHDDVYEVKLSYDSGLACLHFV